MALTEALPAIDRLTDEPILRLDLEDAIRLVWDHLHVVPVDQRCLDRAAALARTQPVRLTDAIHFAAAERLPGRFGSSRSIRRTSASPWGWASTSSVHEQTSAVTHYRQPT